MPDPTPNLFESHDLAFYDGFPKSQEPETTRTDSRRHRQVSHVHLSVAASVTLLSAPMPDSDDLNRFCVASAQSVQYYEIDRFYGLDVIALGLDGMDDGWI